MDRVTPAGGEGTSFGLPPISDSGQVLKSVFGSIPDYVPTHVEPLVQKLVQPGENLLQGQFPAKLSGVAVILAAQRAWKAVNN